METITINLSTVKWTIFIIVTALWYYMCKKETSRGGMLSALGAIIPTFFYMIFIIIWLIIFFAIF